MIIRTLIPIFVLTLAAATRAADDTPNLITKDLSGWKLKNPKASLWKVAADVKMSDKNNKELEPTGQPADDAPVLVNDLKEKQHGSDIYTEKTFGDCELTVEFLVPKSSNSGVYLQGRYEIQVLDSFGKTTPGKGDLGGIYSVKEPLPDNYKPTAPGTWQTLHVVFRAPRFDAAGKKTANARVVSVKLNGHEIQKDVEIPAPTGGQLTNDEVPAGPVMFQGDHGPVAFRNLRVKETK